MDHLRSAVVGYDSQITDVFTEALLQGGYNQPQRSEIVGIVALGHYQPSVVMLDFDHLRDDRLEATRQLRFVLPNCAIAVVSSDLKRSWARKCHMAGASAVLDAAQTASGLLAGVRQASANGCFTDRAFITHNNGNHES